MTTTDDTASAHEKARIIARLAAEPPVGARVICAYYKKKWIGSYTSQSYLSYSEGLMHLRDGMLSICVVRCHTGEAERFIMKFDGGPLHKSPTDIYKYTSDIVRWWFRDEPIPDGIELEDQYGQRIETINL